MRNAVIIGVVLLSGSSAFAERVTVETGKKTKLSVEVPKDWKASTASSSKSCWQSADTKTALCVEWGLHAGRTAAKLREHEVRDHMKELVSRKEQAEGKTTVETFVLHMSKHPERHWSVGVGVIIQNDEHFTLTANRADAKDTKFDAAIKTFFNSPRL